jgi:uracil-DNA glycosylase
MPMADRLIRSTRGERIVGRVVPPLFPPRGPIDVLLVGEAPGPRGADRSGIPFWGDRAGRLLYATLATAGMAEVPDEAWSHWDGVELLRLGLRPRLRNAALSNAVGFCPTRDGRTFCAPRRSDLFDENNRTRMLAELQRAARRCPGRLSVIALGRTAETLLAAIHDEGPDFTLHYLPHPSAQSLAAGRPGTTMEKRTSEWQEQLLRLLQRRPPESTRFMCRSLNLRRSINS